VAYFTFIRKKGNRSRKIYGVFVSSLKACDLSNKFQYLLSFFFINTLPSRSAIFDPQASSQETEAEEAKIVHRPFFLFQVSRILNWDLTQVISSPFIRHEFLSAASRNHCASLYGLMTNTRSCHRR